MHKTEMLSQVIFAKKGSRRHTFLLTRSVIVGLQVLFRGIHFLAEDTRFLTRGCTHNHIPDRRTYPFLKAEMKAFLVPCPVVFCSKGVSAESALENTICVISWLVTHAAGICRPPSPPSLFALATAI